MRGFSTIYILLILGVSIVVTGGYYYKSALNTDQGNPVRNSQESVFSPDFEDQTLITKPLPNPPETIQASSKEDSSKGTVVVNTPVSSPISSPTYTNSNLPVAITSPKEVQKNNSGELKNLPSIPFQVCLEPKNQWNDFIKTKNNIDATYQSHISQYGELAFGTKNKPSDIVAKFAYNHTRMTATKELFYSGSKEIRDTLTSLPSLSKLTVEHITKIKNAYKDGLVSLERSYDLTLSAYAVFSEDTDNISYNDIDISKALLQDAQDQYHDAVFKLEKIDSIIALMKAEMNQKHGCNFTFTSDDTVKTISDDELAFTHFYPTQIVRNRYTEAVIEVKTNLPVVVSDNGKIKKLLWLSCNNGQEVVDATSVDNDSVQVILKQKNYPGERRCHFEYIGNGDAINTNSVTVTI